MRLILAHGEVPTCGDCQRWLYDPARGWERVEKPKGTPQPRPAGSAPPCWQCPKIPAGEPPHPANAVEPGEDVYRMVAHYLRCKAVLRFPADPLVERNAAIIRLVEDGLARAEQARTLRAAAGIAAARATSRG